MISFRGLLLRRLLLVMLLPMAALTLFLLLDIEREGRDSLDRSLRVAARMSEALDRRVPAAELEGELVRLSRALSLRLTIIRADGTVISDSDRDPIGMENHLERPEVREALRDGEGADERVSATIQMPMRYVAVSAGEGSAHRIYRASAPTVRLQAQIARTRWAVVAALLGALLLLIVLSFRVSHEVLGPVDALSGMAARFRAGDARAHVIPGGPEPLRRLGEVFNGMVDRLNVQVDQLDQTQAHLDAVIAQMPDGLLVLDSRGAVTRVNAAAEELFATPGEKLVGRTLLAALMSYALDREVTRVLAGERSSSVDMRLPHGASVRVAMGPLVLGEHVAGVVVLLQDITELRRTDEMRRDFVANVSHELRTPIAAIRALAETLLLRRETRPELVQEYVPRVVQECERVDRLVSDLLLLAQSEAGQLKLQPEPLDAEELVSEIAGAAEPLAAAAGSGLSLEEFADERVMADRFALGQCVRNLIDNALRYAPGAHIRIGSRIQGRSVLLYVSDDGPGIPPEHLPRIFERFYRVDQARSRDANGPTGGGSGLGLSIVRHLTENQGGRVWVESQPGQGSTFYLAFPAAPQTREVGKRSPT